MRYVATLIILSFLVSIAMADYGNLAPTYTNPGVNVTMLWFNVTNTSDTGRMLFNITINQTGTASGSNITAIRILNETNGVINESLNPTFPLTLGINLEINQTRNFTIAIELNSTASDGATVRINVTSLQAEENVSYSALPYVSSTVTIDAQAPIINETLFLTNSANGNISGTMNLTFNISDARSGINVSSVCLKFYQGGTNKTPCLTIKHSGSIYYSDAFDTNNLTDGYYNLSIYAEDNVKNSVQKNITVFVNNTIENVVVIPNDTVAYIGGNDNEWSFIFNITAPISCRPIIRLDEWQANGTSYKISPNGNATWVYNTTSGTMKTYNIKTSYDNTQYIYPPKKYSTNGRGALFQFVLRMIIRSNVQRAGNWFTTYYIKCQ